MATIKKRINISISKDVDDALGKLARRDRVPQATKAAALLKLALEIEEDRFLEIVAHKRDKRGVRWLSHDAIWR